MALNRDCKNNYNIQLNTAETAMSSAKQSYVDACMLNYTENRKGKVYCDWAY